MVKKYSDLVPSYDEYKRLQTVDYLSFESEHQHWKDGQSRYIQSELSSLPRDAKIIDIGCGDGVGLRELVGLGFSNITGIDFNKEKIRRISEELKCRVFEADMHEIRQLDGEDGTFDVVYASHTLEHAFEPVKALNRWKALLKPGGLMFIVLPYPDLETAHNNMVHGAKWEIGLTVSDNGKTVKSFFRSHGMIVDSVKFDKFREDEIWLKLVKGDIVGG